MQGESPQQKEFRDLLSRLRTGDSSLEDWKLLLQRTPDNVIHTNSENQFENATRLLYANKDIADYNYEKLKTFANPIACIEARHSSTLAKNLSPEDGFVNLLFYCKS